MSKSMPAARDLFASASSAKEAALSMDEYITTFDKSVSQSITDPSRINDIREGRSTFAEESGNGTALLERFMVTNKSMSPDALAGLQSALAAQRLQDLQKDITLTSPLSTSFAAFDLEAPAKLLTPRPTPLRNKIPRKKGMGTSHRIKRILGHTGTGTGGVGVVWPGVTEGTTNTFGAVSYQRGPKIAYAADELILPYNSYSLSDSVSWDANYSGNGYQDLRQLSSTSTLYATFLMEERMLLMARGTAAGYSGALAAPVFALTAPATSGTQTALAASTYYVNVTTDAGVSTSGFGESIAGTQATQVVGAGAVLLVTVTPVVGALGYNIYVGTTTGAANLKYQGRTTGTTFVVQGAASTQTKGNTAPFNTTGAVSTRAAADTSAYVTGYDGVLPTLLGPNTGYNNLINSTFSTANPGVEFQDVFSRLFDSVKADPDEIYLNGLDRKQLSDAIKNGSTANYRINLSQTDTGDYVGGAVIGAIHNETTGKLVNFMVHPWLPQGVAPVLSYTLPIPDTEVSDIWANYMVQDYMGIQWPVNQFSYDFSTYFRGTFFCAAPAWNGIVSGITSA